MAITPSHDRPKSWQCITEASELRVQAGYAEHNILNDNNEKVYTAVLSYDERSCWFRCCGCCKPNYGFIPYNSLYPDAPKVGYTRHPLNISGFGVQVYDIENNDVINFHRAPHDVKNISKDEVSKCKCLIWIAGILRILCLFSSV
jgi:hypothetical protein